MCTLETTQVQGTKSRIEGIAKPSACPVISRPWLRHTHIASERSQVEIASVMEALVSLYLLFFFRVVFTLCSNSADIQGWTRTWESSRGLQSGLLGEHSLKSGKQ